VPDSLTSTAIVALSGVAALVLLSALRKARARGEWSGAATFGLVTVMLSTTFVELVVTHLGLWSKIRGPYKGVTWVVPDIAHQFMRLQAIVLTLIAATLFIVQLKRGRTLINLPAVLFVLVGVVSAESALLHGDNPFRPISIVLFAVAFACMVAPRGLGIHIGIGTACMIAAIASGLTFVAQQDFSVFACAGDIAVSASDKCGLLGFNFRGIIENENALAMLFALAMPFVYIGFGSWEGTVLATYLFGLILMTGSRSGMTAGAVTFLALILLRPNIRQASAARIRTRLTYFGLASLLVVGFVMPFLATDPNAYHGRAGLWLMVRARLADPDTLLYGAGMLGWQHVRDSGLIDVNASYSVHNQWLQVLFTTGLLGLLLFLAALGVLVWQARPHYSLVLGCVLTPVFVLALTEQPWPLDSSDWLTWSIPAALLCYPGARRRSAEEDPQSEHSQFETATDGHREDELSSSIWRVDLETAT